MKAKYCLLFFLLLLSSFTFSQEIPLSDILAANNDTTKVNNILAYAKNIMSVDHVKSSELFKKSLSISYDLDYHAGIGTSLLNLGRIKGQGGNYQESIHFFQRAISSFRKVAMVREISSSQLGLGTTYELIGKRDSAVYYYMTAIKVLEEKQYLPELSKAYLNIGTLYNNAKAFPKAILYENKALAIARSLKDTMMLSVIYSGLSLAYSNDHKMAESYKAAFQALSLAKAKNNTFMLARAYDRYASACAVLNRINDAIEAGKQAVKHSLQANDINTYFTASISLAKAYEKNDNYKDQIPVLESALEKCKEVKNILYGDDIYESLANAYYNVGNFKKSADLLTAIYLYRDSVFSKENSRLVAEFEVKYKIAQKEKALSEKQLQITQKDLQLQKSRQYTFYSLGATLVALLIASLIYIDFKNKKKLHARQLESIQKEKEIQLLQALMQGEEKERSRIAKDLHDGVAGILAAVKMHFNSLAFQNESVLQSDGYMQGIKLLDEATIEVRKTSHNLMPEVLLQHGLDKALSRYCNSISNKSMLSVQYDSWGEINRYKDSFELSVYRIVQELINNILKHSKATQAIVQVSQQENILSITIEDNGVGFHQKNQKDGMGLNSLQLRIKAMNGRMELETGSGSGVSAYLEFDVTGLIIEIANAENLME
jgi:signal transduction histidine kinase